MPKTYIIVAAFSYFLGSIPFGYLLVRFFMKQDIRATGSGNIGATNVARSGARGLALATLLLDAGKGFAAVALAKYEFATSENLVDLAALAALFAVIGHCFPIWLRFRGGKGVATALGVFAALAPKAILISLGLFIAVLLFSRYVSLGSICAATIFPLAAFFIYSELRLPLPMVLIVCLCLIIIVKHRQNIRRLMAGTEARFGANT